MPKFEVHLAIADKIYALLGIGVIRNPSLFFCGNLAPDAYETRSNYGISDKKRTHMCEDEVVHSYGYGYPEVAEQFKIRINEFIKNYYMNADENRDLYLGYIVHLLTDEIYRVKTYQLLEEHLKNNGICNDEPDFRKNLADKVADGEYKDIFSAISNAYRISTHEYPFKQNMIKIFDTIWCCEVRNYISAKDISAFNGFVLNSLQNAQKRKKAIYNDHDKAIEFVDFTANEIIARISGGAGITRII